MRNKWVGEELRMNRIKELYLGVEKKYPNLAGIFEALFLLGVGLFLFCQAIMTTTFPSSFLIGLAGLLAQLIQLAVIIKTGLQLKYWKQILLSLVISFVFTMVYHSIDLNLMAFYAWIIVGMVGVSHRKVLRLQVVVVGSMVLCAVISSLAGTISNLVYLEQDGLRDSFGICYPTDFAAYLFYLLLFFWVAWEKLPDYVTLVLCIPYLAVVTFLNRSDSGTIAGLCLVVAVVICMILWKWPEAKYVKLAKKALAFVLPAVFPLCAIFMFVLIGAYGMQTKFGVWLNAKLTGRLHWAYVAIKENGIHAFGNVISMHGWGFTTFPVEDYNFVDSTYPLLLVKYGWVLFAVLMICWIWMTYVAIKEENYRLSFVLALIAVHSLAEHHFIELHYNVLLLMPFATFGLSAGRKNDGKDQGEQAKKAEEAQKAKGFSLIPLLTMAIIFLLALAAPLWLSCLRTICSWKRVSGDGVIVVGIGAVVVIILFLILFVNGCRMLMSYLREGREKKKLPMMIGCLAASCILLIGSIIWTNAELSKARAGYDKTLTADDAAMNLICANKKTKVYVSHMPVLYRERHKNVTYSAFMGEDLARYQNCCVVASRKNNYNLFFRKGFWYFPISEDTCVYTNDQDIRDVLASNAYVGTDYYPEIRKLHSADSMDLVKGRYTVSVKLRVKDVESVKDGNALGEGATDIRIFGKGGKEVLLQESVGTEHMEEDGTISENLFLELKGDTSEVVFYLLPVSTENIEVEEFTIQMTP